MFVLFVFWPSVCPLVVFLYLSMHFIFCLLCFLFCCLPVGLSVCLCRSSSLYLAFPYCLPNPFPLSTSLSPSTTTTNKQKTQQPKSEHLLQNEKKISANLVIKNQQQQQKKKSNNKQTKQQPRAGLMLRFCVDLVPARADITVMNLDIKTSRCYLRRCYHVF